MGRWRDSWAVRNPSVRLAWPMPQTRLPLWFRATGSSALMEVLPDMAAASAESAGCSFTRGSLWRSLPRDVFQKRHESLNPSQARVSKALERIRQLVPSHTRGRSRMRESRPYGSVRGARGNSRPYRALLSVANFAAPAQVSFWHHSEMP